MRRKAWAGGVALISAAGVAAAIGTLVYLWIVWGDRGLYADATGTSGYSSPTESILLVGSLIAIPTLGIIAIASLIFWLVQRRSGRKTVGS